MVPWGSTSPVTWSPRNHLARSPRTPGSQGTRFCVRMVPRGSTSRATWSLVHHPRRRPTRPGHERTRTRAKLVPRGPSSRGIWSLVRHLARSWLWSAGGVAPRGPDSERIWSLRDQIGPSTWSLEDQRGNNRCAHRGTTRTGRARESQVRPKVRERPY